MKCNQDHRPSGLARLAVALASAAVLWVGSAHAGEAKKAGGHEGIDTEHIFGFTEGTDIGEKGEVEGESENYFRFGKPGSYTGTENEVVLRYVITDQFRVSGGVAFNYFNIQDVPGLPDRNSFNFGGFVSEAKWRAVERTAASPVGLTFAVSPGYGYRDELSGDPVDSFSIPATLLVDAELIPGKLFTAFNMSYGPSFSRGNGGWEREDGLEFSLAAAYAISSEVLIGGEVRHLSGGEKSLFESEALYVGPSLYYQLTDTSSIKGTISFQIPDETTHRIDLVNYERYQALLLLVKIF